MPPAPPPIPRDDGRAGSRKWWRDSCKTCGGLLSLLWLLVSALLVVWMMLAAISPATGGVSPVWNAAACAAVLFFLYFATMVALVSVWWSNLDDDDK